LAFERVRLRCAAAGKFAGIPAEIAPNHQIIQAVASLVTPMGTVFDEVAAIQGPTRGAPIRAAAMSASGPKRTSDLNDGQPLKA